jgi:Rod binding domain-containing protein
MAQLEFSLINPVAGLTVGRKIAVSGGVRTVGLGSFPSVRLTGVRVVFGDGGPETLASITNGRWTCVGSPLSAVPGGSSVTITAIAAGTSQDNVGTPEEPMPGEDKPFERLLTVVVRLDGDIPEILTIDPFLSPVTPPLLPHHLDLTGTAADAQTGISSVQLRVGSGEFVDVDNASGDFSRWAKGVDLPAGQHHFTVRALDGAGNLREATADISVRLPFEPGDVEQVFQPTRYLLELLRFAARYVTPGDSTIELTPAMLAERFHQPFDRLTESSVFEQATRSLPQARITVEVLRGHLGVPAPAELDQRFRGMAYQTILRQLGTSYNELRLARTADPGVRQALAARLGIGVLSARPDRLDEVTVSPETISDAQLEGLFGYQSTAVGDPLRTPVDAAGVLLWQRAALGSRWQREDEAQRDLAERPLPVIDPDIVGNGHLRSRDPADPAFSLWTARSSWITEQLVEIEGAAPVDADPLVRFDQMVATKVGALDLPVLAARDAEGGDIGLDLSPLDLSLEAFRFLARSRAVLAAGVLLETEWRDVVSILLQVQKRRQYRAWRLEERSLSLVLQPSSFVLEPAKPGEETRPPEIPHWRSQQALYTAWRQTLAARTTQSAALEAGYQSIVDVAEAQVLPALRDALIAVLGERQPTPELPEVAGERLTRELMIDLRATSGQRTTRVDQALETVQGVLFSTRAGRLAADESGRNWTISIEATDERDFDREWDWMGGYRSWLSAMRVFAFQENQLFRSLHVADPNLTAPTRAFRDLIEMLRKERRLTPDTARRFANDYLTALRAAGSAVVLEPQLREGFVITDERSDGGLVALQELSGSIFHPDRQHQREIFWLVPMALALKLQGSGQFRAALDWYQTVYAYHLPPPNRRIYRGLQQEADIESNYDRVPEWLIKELNPHVIAQQRRNCYTRSTVMSIVGCFLSYGDAEFSRNTVDANARARTLYETAVDLLGLPEAAPETGPTIPFPSNPVWESLRQHAQSNLSKIHRGLNIAGISTGGPSGREEDGTVLPSQYRYSALVDRAKNLVSIAQQVEAAFLSALEQRDAKTYDALQAGHDIQVASSSIAIHDIRLADANIGVQLAGLQRERAQLQEDHYDQQLRDGLSRYEQAGLAALGTAVLLQLAAGVSFTVSAAVGWANTLTAAGASASAIGQALAAFSGAASTSGQISQTLAGYERREEEWQLQRSLARKDGEIGDQQVLLALNQLRLAGQERELAGLQFDHALAVTEFLATKFTNAELFEWMSGVLGDVYAYFLQQATALAQIAEAQLAFERQELAGGIVGTDYWRDETTDGSDVLSDGARDRRGLTGSARLLQDIYRLDQYAFETDRRKLHLTQTLPLSQLAAYELQQLRETGVLTFATPEELFDREFPGHYLRLIKRVRVSLIALLPPVRGVRATLSASGISRTVVARGPFDTVTLRREPEAIAFTSPINASGLFELEPENGLLLPFEGMGVDAAWRLELPKPANPFDYRTIADVLLTIEYTALDSHEYRQQVVRTLDRRFSGDRSFSLRNQFPDAWYELNNPDTIENPDRRMRAVLPLSSEDFPPHIQDLGVAQLSLFCVRKDELADELNVISLSHTAGGQTTTGDEVRTTSGVISTRRPTGAPWQVLLEQNPAGDWEIRVENNELVRTWFRDGLIEDVVLVMTLAGTTPAWP